MAKRSPEPVEGLGRESDNMMSDPYVVTGVTSGIGKEMAVELARRGARVIGVCRPGEKSGRARDEIRRRSGGAIELVTGDLSLMAETRRVAEDILRLGPRIGVLVNNAGVGVGRARTVTAEGLETTLAVNYVSPFILASLLLSRLAGAAPSRIVNVASVAHRRIVPDRDDIWAEKAPPRLLYRLSKLYLIMFTYELARRLAATGASSGGVTVNACCPGGVSTGIWRNFTGPVNFWKRIAFLALLKGAKSGARLPLYLATSPDVAAVSGRYFEVRSHLRGLPCSPERTEVRSSPVSYDEDFQRRLWDATAKLTGVS